MKRGRLFPLLVALASFSVSCRSTQNVDSPARSTKYESELRSQWSPREGYEHLVGIKRFAFGGVGFFGGTSNGEFAFCAILKSPKASDLFKDIYLQGTDEGKLYALCGLRVIDHDAFNHYFAIFRTENKRITTQSGCVIREEPAGEVIQRIVAGYYDSHFTER
jgi:hypothetical protein